jgi:chemotaxis protein MotB
MRRERREFERAGHDRWLVSYADFVTLLFALFVVLFASSQVDRRKVGDAVRRAFDGSERPKVTSVLGGTVATLGQGNRMMRGPGGSNIYVPVPRALESAELLPSREFLDRELAEEIDAGRLSIHMEARGMVVSLREASYFVSGEDQVAPALYPVLEKIASTVLKTSNPIRLEGHTDSIPIHNTRFRSNWELSTSRAIAMMDALRTQFGVPSMRMAVAGYADNFPVDTNDTPEGRARNRRVDLVILGQSGLVSLPDTIRPEGATTSAPVPGELPREQPAAPVPASPGAPPSR